jgi:hypothetical protein
MMLESKSARPSAFGSVSAHAVRLNGPADVTRTYGVTAHDGRCAGMS